MSDWIDIGTARKSSIDSNMVYYRYSETKYKTRKLSISIGNKVAETMGWKKGDPVRIVQNRNNHSVFMVEPATTGRRYRLNQPRLSRAVTATATVSRELRLRMDDTVHVYFEICRNGIMIDTSRKPSEEFVLL